MAQDSYPPPDAAAVATSTADSQQMITQFRQRIAEHVAAIQTAGRETLVEQTGVQEPSPREIRLEITVGPDPKASRLQANSVECWDQDYVCGKTPTGYLHCTVRVCMEIGPITISR
jgi:hypothetical protein